MDTAESIQADKPILKEHDPLTELLSQIPHKVQRGLKTQHEPLELTCIDVNPQFIALGSNIGTVFLYDREKHTIQRLRSDDTTVYTRCVALHSGLDNLVAIGYSSGSIYIFQLPSALMGHSKQLERFVVEDLHQVSLTTLTWSTNGMKLFSGDMHGCVGCTEVDFIEGKCKSSPLLIESNTEIVQLQQGHRSLLVATKHRCLVCRMDDKDRIVQIGSKDRKITGDFGACFIPAMCKPEDAQLFASRPGYRVWKASINGTVLNTFIFKDLLMQTNQQIPLLDFTVTNIETGQRSNQLGPMLLYKEDQIVSWNESCLFVLDVEKTAVVGMQNHIGRIKAVVVSGDEIFLLRTDTDRNVIRIAHKPLQSSKYKLLKQVQEEREQREREQKAKEQEKLAEEAKKEVNTETSKAQEKSPFKLLHGNIMDKVKIIAKPTVLKDKIQEKLKIDHKKNAPSKYTQEYVFEGESKDSKWDYSPPGPLPPVVRLDSPDLLHVEISDSSIEVTMEKVPSTERFSILSGDSSQMDKEIVTNEDQSFMSKTGTGASSALARLQEDHKMEENSEPIFKVADTPTDQLIAMYTEEAEEEDGIVFSRKTKHKKKKKSRERKPRINPLTGEQDQDTVSMNSAASVDSNPSEQSSSTGQAEPDVEPGVGPCAEAGAETESVNSEPVIGESEVLKTLPLIVTGEIGNDKCDDDRTEVNVKRDETSNLPDDKEPVLTTEDQFLDVKDKSFEDGKNDTRVEDSFSFDEPDSVCKETPKEKSCELDKTEEIKMETSQTSDMSGSLYDEYVPTLDPLASNLDKEMARLDSYLGETKDSLRTDLEGTTFERSTSDIGMFKSGLSVENGLDDLYSLSGDDGAKDRNKSRNLEDQLQQLEEIAMSSAEPSDHPQDGSSSLRSLSSLPSLDRTSSTSGEDFYSKYATKSPNEMSPSTEDTFSDENTYEPRPRSRNLEDESKVLDLTDSSSFLRSVNNWTENAAYGNILSLSVSKTHVWITDRSYNIHFSRLDSTVLNWKKATGSASHISVSPCGNIVWVLNKNTVSAGTKITPRRPEGMKWVEAVRDVANLCVDKTCAWYIKTNYEVMLQTGLSKERPCYKAEQVDCAHKLKQVVCRDGVVWALTEDCRWLYRAGIKQDCPKGSEWKTGDSGSEHRLFSHLALGDDNLAWAVDVVGQVWFRTGVTMATPRGDGKWWQVPLSGEYFMKDPSTLDMLKSFSTKFDPQKLAHLLTAQSGGLVSGTSGLWVVPEYKNILHVCRGHIEGQLWEDAQPESLSSTASWKTIACKNAGSSSGLIWGQQPSGDLFAFSVDRKSCFNIQAPVKQSGNLMFVCMSVCRDALWGLTYEGEIHIRTGMSLLEPKGTGWCHLDLSQIDESHLVHISCSNMNVWAVDSDGQIFHRIGVKAPTDLSLNAAWLPVDNGGTVFTQIVTGAQEWKVWAIDNRRQVYVRTGITSEMPIGRKWMHVSGTQAMQLTISGSFVWALNYSGELLCRHGVSIDNITGDYWKKQPGFLINISAAPNNNLWGISKDGQLLRRRTRYIIHESRSSTGEADKPGGRRGISIGSDDGDWELV